MELYGLKEPYMNDLANTEGIQERLLGEGVKCFLPNVFLYLESV